MSTRREGAGENSREVGRILIIKCFTIQAKEFMLNLEGYYLCISEEGTTMFGWS